MEEHRVKGHKKYDWAYWITLKHTSFEFECVGSPAWSFNNRSAVGVAVVKIVDYIIREKVSFEGFLYEGVWDTSKSILKVKKCYMASEFLRSSIFNDFLHGKVVLDASIYALDKGLLGAAVDVPVLGHELGHPVGLDLVEWFSNA